MKTTQTDKAKRFKSLHEGPKCFVVPNPWDAGSARLLTSLGFDALATTSAGFACTLGRRDGEGRLTREEVLENVRSIVVATELPVSADLENGYGDDPEDAADMIRLASETGLVGGSIEDATGNKEAPIYELDLAVERVLAAVEAARASPFPFTLTARAENFLHGRPDLDDTIRRLQAFQDAGADVLYAPGIATEEHITAVTSAVDRPVNVVIGGRAGALTIEQLERWGVKRISLGSALSRTALGALMKAAREIRDHGTFGFIKDALTFDQLNKVF